MFLLIRDQRSNPGRKLQQFTFHNVSINTVLQHRSTVLAVTFTFHNVSINIIKAITLTNTVNEFTFHNVSINTVTAEDNYVMKHTFTFHNVSINTKEKNILYLHFTNLHSTMFLLIRRKEQPSSRCNRIYIPQCFY